MNVSRQAALEVQVYNIHIKHYAHEIFSRFQIALVKTWNQRTERGATEELASRNL